MSFNFLKYQRRYFSVLNNYRSAENPKVFFEIAINQKNAGKLVFEVKRISHFSSIFFSIKAQIYEFSFLI